MARFPMLDFRLHPLVPVAVLWVVGLAIGTSVAAPLAWMLVGTGAMCVAWAVAERLRRHELANGLLATAIVLAGVGYWQWDQRCVPAGHLARLLPGDPEAPAVPVSVRLRLVTMPEASAVNPDVPAFLARPTQHAVGQVDEVLTTAGWRPATGLATVRLPAACAAARGQRIEVIGYATRPRGPGNPGEFDYARYLATSRIFVQLSARHENQVRLLDSPTPPGPAAWLEDFRTFLRGKLHEHTAPYDEDAADTMVALLLGHRDPGMQPITTAFARAGAAHLLAISGTHIVLMAAVVWFLLRGVAARPRWRAVLTAAFIVVYILATPAGPPVLRAGLAMLLILAANLLGRPPGALNGLAAALLAVLLFRPADMLDAGFQLSFVATVGLLLLCPHVQRLFFANYLAFHATLARARGTRTARILQGTRTFVTTAASANLVGCAVSLPLVAFHFHQFTPWAFVSGLLVLPVITLLMVASLVQLLAAIASAALGSWLALATTELSSWTVWLVTALAHLPGASWGVPSPPVWLLALYYLLLLAMVLRRPRALVRQISPTPLYSRATVAVAAMAVLTVAAGCYAYTPKPSHPILAVLSVGRGSALVLTTPEGGHVLINSGSLSSTGVSARVIEPFLRSQGINRIDAVMVTQAADGTTNALPDLLALYPPREFLVSGADQADRASMAAIKLLARARRAGVAATALHAGDRVRFSASVTGDVLWPPADMGALPPSQRGWIVRIRFGERTILLLEGKQVDAVSVLQANGGLPACDAAVFVGPDEPSAEIETALRAAGTTQFVSVAQVSAAPAAVEPDGPMASAHAAVAVELAADGVRVVPLRAPTRCVGR